MTRRRKPRTVSSIVALARALGVHRNTVTRWTSRGCPRNEDGSFDVAAVERWVRGYRSLMNDRSADGVRQRTDLGRTGTASLERAAADANYRKIRSAIAAIDLQERRDSVVPRQDVADMLRARRTLIGRRFAAIRRRLVPRVAGVQDAREIERLVDEELDAFLRDAYGDEPRDGGVG